MKDLKISLFYAIMVTEKIHLGLELAAHARWYGSTVWGADHNLDHLRVWTTWKLWVLQHVKARFSDKKARKSTQNEAKNRCFCVWDVDAAGSNPVTPTKIGFGKQFPKPFSLFSAMQILRADDCFRQPSLNVKTAVL